MKIYQLPVLFAFLTISGLTGCRKNSIINEKQAILFQLDFVNNIWGYQHSGFLIDNQGNILTYENPIDWNSGMNLTEDQVHENIENCNYSGSKIDPVDLRRFAGYIKNISSSKITARKNVAEDEGSLEFICFRYSESSGTYKGTLIKMEGDYACENLNFYSKRVTIWLRSINASLTKNRLPV